MMPRKILVSSGTCWSSSPARAGSGTAVASKAAPMRQPKMARDATRGLILAEIVFARCFVHPTPTAPCNSKGIAHSTG